MRTIVIDGRDMKARKSLHAFLMQHLSLPEYYGGNLDALYDCLGDIREQTHFHLSHLDALEKNLGAYAAKFLKVLEDAAESNSYLSVSISGDKD